MILTLLAVITACKKVPEVNKEYVDVERDQITVGTTSATIQCDYQYIATLKKAYLYYGEGEDATDMTSAEMRVVENALYVDLTDLKENTIYSYYYEFVNGFNSMQTVIKTFKTKNGSGGGGGNGNAPEGAIDGLFSVSPARKVYFSQGNLQYQASTNTWRFAEHQWDYVGDNWQGTVYENGIKCNNSLISSLYDGWIDLFGWGTSGWNNGNTYYMPYNSDNSDPKLYGPPGVHDLTGEYANADWGIFNSISNGGNQAGFWRTLTADEWEYLITSRPTTSNYRYVKATVNDIIGLILLPDDWNISYYSLNNPNDMQSDFSNNTLSTTDWAVIESNGAIFLPASGYRDGTSMKWVGGCGYYRSTTCYLEDVASSVEFHDMWVHYNLSNPRYYGFSVRLVHDGGSQPSVTAPTVVTFYASDITSNSASCNGEVTSDGGATVTERGFCWSTIGTPSLNDNHIAVGTGIGDFNTTLNGLEANTTYFVRAYAINEVGTAYGERGQFTTLSGGGGGSGNVPVGAIDGLFTINANGDQVYFSQGNLQYQASTNTWRFAENQWDYVGDGTWGTVFEENSKCNNNLVSSTYNGWIDLYAWGTSGFDHGAICYQPWINNSNIADHNAYGSSTYNLFDQTGQADWGYNSIVNGGNELGLWRTFTFAELFYIFELRSTNSEIRYAKAEVNEIPGYLIVPDDWSQSLFVLRRVNEWAVDYNVNSISLSDWTFLESNGVVFIPAAGYRENDDGLVHGLGGISCGYWTSSVADGVYAHCFYSYTGPSGYSWSFPGSQGGVRNKGFSIRLVQNAH